MRLLAFGASNVARETAEMAGVAAAKMSTEVEFVSSGVVRKA